MGDVTKNFKARLAQQKGREVSYQGFPLLLRRAPLEIWLRNNRLPEHLTALYLYSLAGDSDTAIERGLPNKLSEDQAKAHLKFRQDVIEFCCVEPAVDFSGDSKTEKISAEEIESAAPGILSFVYNYGMGIDAAAPIETEGGEITAGDLSTFQPEQIESRSGRLHGETIPAKAVNVAGAD